MKKISPPPATGADRVKWHLFDRALAEVRLAAKSVPDRELESTIDEAVLGMRLKKRRGKQ